MCMFFRTFYNMAFSVERSTLQLSTPGTSLQTSSINALQEAQCIPFIFSIVFILSFHATSFHNLEVSRPRHSHRTAKPDLPCLFGSEFYYINIIAGQVFSYPKRRN